MSLAGCIRRLFRRCRRHHPPRERSNERRDIVMLSEVDYFALANVLINQYGADAKTRAASLMHEAQQNNDAAATADWLTVEHAIALLTNDSVATRH
jgi:hypothetical protein